MYPFFFEVTYGFYNPEWQERTQAAIVYAENFTNAVNQIENYYGDELVSLKVECGAEGDIFVGDTDAMRQIWKEM